MVILDLYSAQLYATGSSHLPGGVRPIQRVMRLASEQPRELALAVDDAHDGYAVSP